MAVVFDRRTQPGCRYHSGEVRRPWTVRYAEPATGRMRERSFASEAKAREFHKTVEALHREAKEAKEAEYVASLHQQVSHREFGAYATRWIAVHRDDGPIVYRLYDASGQVIYVGRSTKGLQRCFDHRGKPWVRAEYRQLLFESSLDEAEAEMIHEHHPPLNKICYRCDYYKR